MDSTKITRLVMQSLKSANRLQVLGLYGFKYIKQDIADLTDLLQRNKNSLKSIVITYDPGNLNSLDGGHLHRKTFAAFVEALASLGS